MGLILTSEATAALKSGNRVWDFRFARVQDDIESAVPEPVVRCSVSANDLADKAKRTCTVVFPADTTFDYLVHSLRVYARLRLADLTWQEFCLGTFLLSMPTTTVDAPRSPIEAQGFDYLVKWSEVTMSGRFVPDIVINSYGSLLDQMAFAITGYLGGISYPQAAYTLFLPATYEFDTGTSRLTIINALLAGLRYTPLRVDEFGEAYSTEYLTPDEQPPVWAYTRDQDGVIIHGSTTVTLDLFDMPNEWVGVISHPDLNNALVSTVTNAEPSSRTSTVTRGRTITKIWKDDELGAVFDQATLDLIILDRSMMADQQFLQVEFETPLMPFHGLGDTIDLDYGQGLERFREVEWSLDCISGGRMKHTARRVVTI